MDYKNNWKVIYVIGFMLVLSLIAQMALFLSLTGTLKLDFLIFKKARIRIAPKTQNNKLVEKRVEIKKKEPKFLGIESILQLRKQHAERQCDKIKNKEPVLNISRLDHIYVDLKHKFIYCYVPKAASTQWRKILMANYLGWHDLERISPKQMWDFWYMQSGLRRSRKLRQIKHYQKDSIERMFKTFFKFMFVRDPLERVLSVWNDKFMDRHTIFYRDRLGTNILKMFRKNVTASDLKHGYIRFNEFIKYILMSNSEYDRDEHWSRYYDLCRPCDVHYDVIGTYETLNIDSDYVLERLGILDKFRFPVSTSKAKSLSNQYLATLDLQDKQHFYDIFKRDYEMFGYKML